MDVRGDVVCSGRILGERYFHLLPHESAIADVRGGHGVRIVQQIEGRVCMATMTAFFHGELATSFERLRQEFVNYQRGLDVGAAPLFANDPPNKCKKTISTNFGREPNTMRPNDSVWSAHCCTCVFFCASVVTGVVQNRQPPM